MTKEQMDKVVEINARRMGDEDIKWLVNFVMYQEEEIKAGAHMLADMHNKKNDIEIAIRAQGADMRELKREGEKVFNNLTGKLRDSEKENAALRKRLKPVEDVYEKYKKYAYVDIPSAPDYLLLKSDTIIELWNAIKAAAKEHDETKK